MGPQALSTGIYGPLPSNMFGLILGRSSVTMKGLQVFPGIVDSDYIGEIKIMAKAIDNIIIIPQGDRIAQLLLLPLLKTANKVQSPLREREDPDPQTSTGYSPLLIKNPLSPYG